MLSLSSQQDTEFPGIVCRPIITKTSDYHYQHLKLNVDMLKVIQVGLCLCDAQGEEREGGNVG